jgi:uncharacterized membrane protein
MSDAAPAPQARETHDVPAVREMTIAWIAYGLHAVGLILPFVIWPALGGLIVNYVKRGDTATGFVDGHHRWMIRTFWWGLAGYVVGVAVMAASAAPALIAAWRAQGGQIDLGWSELLSLVAAASVGLAILLAVWFWLIYRIIKGAIRLYDKHALP